MICCMSVQLPVEGGIYLLQATEYTGIKVWGVCSFMHGIVVVHDDTTNNDSEFLQIVSVTGSVIIDCALHVSTVQNTAKNSDWVIDLFNFEVTCRLESPHVLISPFSFL